jgi:ubiquinone/menaquinone biosynthesis C-methylase UbiE
MGLEKKRKGLEVERIPDVAFRLMSWIFVIRDMLFSVGKKLDQFGIEEGFYLVDFGCGPGSYLEHASRLVGATGKVYAVDVHPLAVAAVREKISKRNLKNVNPVLATGYPVNIDSHSIDIIYALDMFHHIKDSQPFLEELQRLLKPEGTLFIESGHQRLNAARQKILDSGCWKVITEDRNLFTCVPKKPEDN